MQGLSTNQMEALTSAAGRASEISGSLKMLLKEFPPLENEKEFFAIRGEHLGKILKDANQQAKNVVTWATNSLEINHFPASEEEKQYIQSVVHEFYVNIGYASDVWEKLNAIDSELFPPKFYLFTLLKENAYEIKQAFSS